MNVFVQGEVFRLEILKSSDVCDYQRLVSSGFEEMAQVSPEGPCLYLLSDSDFSV